MTAKAEQPVSLVAALAQVQAKLPRVAKGETAHVTGESKQGKAFSYSYSYADLADVSQIMLPLLGDVGLAWITKPTLLDDGRLVLEYKLAHVSGETEEGHYPLPSGGSPQEIGSAITYARRYTLCAVTGVAPESDDDDGATATVAHAAKTQREVKRDRQPPDPKKISALVDRAYAMTSPNELRGLWSSAAAEGLLDAECIDREGEVMPVRDLLQRQADALKTGQAKQDTLEEETADEPA